MGGSSWSRPLLESSVFQRSAQCGPVEIIKQSRNATAFQAMMQLIVGERGTVCPGIEPGFLDSLGLVPTSLMFTAARLDDPAHLCSFSILKTVTKYNTPYNTLILQLICSARGLDYGRVVLNRIIAYAETAKYNIGEIELQSVESAIPFYLRHGFAPHSDRIMYTEAPRRELSVPPEQMAAFSEEGWKVQVSGLLTMVRRTPYYQPFVDLEWE